MCQKWMTDTKVKFNESVKNFGTCLTLWTSSFDELIYTDLYFEERLKILGWLLRVLNFCYDFWGILLMETSLFGVDLLEILNMKQQTAMNDAHKIFGY